VYVGNSPLDIEVVYKGMLPTAEDYRKLTRKYMEKGKIVTDIPDDFEIRRYVLSQLRELEV
ncbi:MAG: nicotinate phosphoribosyltransferase, partial [Candidatus Neomarinimicrobiota bacterium]